MHCDNLGLSPNCQEVLHSLLDNPDDCQTTNELTKISKHRGFGGDYRKNWNSVKGCVVELLEKGLIYKDEKCLQYGNCYRVKKSESNRDFDEGCFAEPEINSSKSSFYHTDLHVSEFENGSDSFVPQIGNISHFKQAKLGNQAW